MRGACKPEHCLPLRHGGVRNFPLSQPPRPMSVCFVEPSSVDSQVLVALSLSVGWDVFVDVGREEASVGHVQDLTVNVVGVARADLLVGQVWRQRGSVCRVLVTVLREGVSSLVSSYPLCSCTHRSRHVVGQGGGAGQSKVFPCRRAMNAIILIRVLSLVESTMVWRRELPMLHL